MIITVLSAKRNLITRLTHKRIWNVVLLASFLISALLAVFLIIRINWGVSPRLPFNMLYWHVEAGTVMLVISIFHIFERRLFYICMLAFKNKKEAKRYF